MAEITSLSACFDAASVSSVVNSELVSVENALRKEKNVLGKKSEYFGKHTFCDMGVTPIQNEVDKISTELNNTRSSIAKTALAINKKAWKLRMDDLNLYIKYCDTKIRYYENVIRVREAKKATVSSSGTVDPNTGVFISVAPQFTAEELSADSNLKLWQDKKKEASNELQIATQKYNNL